MRCELRHPHGKNVRCFFGGERQSNNDDNEILAEILISHEISPTVIIMKMSSQALLL